MFVAARLPTRSVPRVPASFGASDEASGKDLVRRSCLGRAAQCVMVVLGEGMCDDCMQIFLCVVRPLSPTKPPSN